MMAVDDDESGKGRSTLRFSRGLSTKGMVDGMKRKNVMKK